MITAPTKGLFRVLEDATHIPRRMLVQCERQELLIFWRCSMPIDLVVIPVTLNDIKSPAFRKVCILLEAASELSSSPDGLELPRLVSRK